MVVSKQKRKSHISEVGEGLKIVLPTEKTWLVYMVVMLMTGLLLFGIPALNKIFHNESGIERSVNVFGWFLGMIGFIFIILYVWAWDVFGNEIITIDRENLSIRKLLWNSGKLHQYKTIHVKNLRISPKLHRYEVFKSLLSDETIAFDYEGKTYRFAAGVEKAEIRSMYQKILEKFPDFITKK